MKRLARFAVARPLLFGVVMVVVWALLAALTYPLRVPFPEDELGQLVAEAVSKAAICLVLVLLLWRLGWLRASGLPRLGNRRTWLLASAVGIYLVAAQLYAFTGHLGPVVGRSPLAIAQFPATLPGALMEELLFRGLILGAMVLAWGHTRRGFVKSVVLSSLLFGATHMVNLLVRPSSLVLLQAIVVSVPGILYGALLLRTHSLWPAIVIHWLANAAVNVKVADVAGWEETPTMWLVFALLLIPTIVASALLLSRLPAVSEKDTIVASKTLGQEEAQMAVRP